MGYQETLEAAGATVHCFEQFGSYQGDWFAKVTVNGKTGWIHGYFGSCSVCDAFESEFDYGSRDRCGEHEYEREDAATCEACKSAAESYQTRLAAFGAKYLEDIMTQEEAEKEAGRNLEWDMDATAMLNYVRANHV
jgi:hypothetical protein